ncbi:putative protein PHOX1-4 [Helianthus debilis subsp. tardiflorus]
MLYERSSMEYKLGLLYWHECLEIAVEKFEVAGVSLMDIAVIVRNHCSNDSAPKVIVLVLCFSFGLGKSDLITDQFKVYVGRVRVV